MMYVSHVEEGLSKVQLATQEQIMHAQYMARIGYHGVCEYCNTEIPIERIEALPYATNCIECAALNEAENGDDVSSPRGQHHEGWSHCRNQEDEPSGSLDRVRR
ncbi:TraR/DksA C4-type zinc finger protein [Candidatus Peregrinibacteria bacterium]|nr:TraR/DksA C4-type zinc finger protein [Candidatus Peregrinibacteria bacterium]